MFLYLLKKGVFDSVNHFFKVIFYNLILIFWIGILISTLMKLKSFRAVPILLFIVVVTIMNTGFMVLFQRNSNWSKVIRQSSVLGILNAVIAAVAFYSIAYYFSINSMFFKAIGFMAVWITLFWCIVSTIAMCIIVKKDLNFKETIRESIIFSIVNIKEILFLLPSYILTYALNAFVVIGGGAALISLLNFYELMRIKEKYIIKNGIVNGKVSWKKILKEEKKSVKKQDFKDLVFPWQLKKNKKK